MTSRLTALALFSSLTLLAGASSAQTIKPGLWEINNKVQSSNTQFGMMMAEMQKQLASMSPEQRKAMEDMMQKNAGAAMPVMKDGGMVVKTCISKEMVAQGQLPVQQYGNCQHQRGKMVGNSMKISFSCTNPASSGEGDIKFMGDSAYTMKMSMTSSPAGKPETMNMEGSGKWLGADCGTLKPIQMPPAAATK